MLEKGPETWLGGGRYVVGGLGKSYGNHAGGWKPPRVPLLPPAIVSSVALGKPPLGMALQPGQAERLDEPFHLPLFLLARPAGWRKGRLPLQGLSTLPPDEGAEGVS